MVEEKEAQFEQLEGYLFVAKTRKRAKQKPKPRLSAEEEVIRMEEEYS